MLSRETGLLMNNVILVVAAVVILLGTLYPLISDALQLGKVSVGRQYFDPVFMVLMLPLLALLGVGVTARWKRDTKERLWSRLRIPLILSVGLALLWALLLTPQFYIMAFVGLWLALWLIASTVAAIRDRLQPHYNWRHVPRGFWGMVLGHVGLAVFVIGVTLTSSYSTEKDIRLAPGETYEMAGYSFEFNGVETVPGPNYTAYRGTLVAREGDEFVANMYPEKRTYLVQKMPMTEAAIDEGLFRDLFVALGEDLGNGAWSLRVYHKPFIGWLWIGATLMALGGLLAATDRRYRTLARRSAAATENSAKASA
jgi:cytochrome c-type biogenesis protein CcmF